VLETPRTQSIFLFSPAAGRPEGKKTTALGIQKFLIDLHALTEEREKCQSHYELVRDYHLPSSQWQIKNNLSAYSAALPAL
jgi:hypothetical protein